MTTALELSCDKSGIFEYRPNRKHPWANQYRQRLGARLWSASHYRWCEEALEPSNLFTVSTPTGTWTFHRDEEGYWSAKRLDGLTPIWAGQDKDVYDGLVSGGIIWLCQGWTETEAVGQGAQLTVNDHGISVLVGHDGEHELEAMPQQPEPRVAAQLLQIRLLGKSREAFEHHCTETSAVVQDVKKEADGSLTIQVSSRFATVIFTFPADCWRRRS